MSVMRNLVLVLSLVGRGAQRPCSSNQQCISGDDCPAFIQLKARFDSLQDGTSERARLLEQLQESVCERADKLVCCAVDQEVSGGDSWTEPHQYPFMVLIVIKVGF